MELLDVYDSQGNKTGRVVERGNKNEIFNNDEHIAVAIIYIENDKGEFLIQKTSKEKGEHYSSTGGHISYGEDAYSTIVREVKEELGIDISKNDIEYISTIERKKKYVDIYYVELSSNIIDKVVMQKDEVDDVKWISKREIEALHDKKKFKETHYNYYLELLKYKKFK